ncbi:MAG: hypothetical protein HKN03_00145 [Acidimicrobiales bacterium]|nr:hypothetical protein [Acidimicrobiales bacterium]
MPARIALLACTDAMDLDTDGPFLFPALDAAGLEYDVVAWDDPKAKWASYTKVILRATWDYFTRLDEFRAVLEHITSQTELLNPLEVVEWNVDKRYVTELRQASLPVVDTAFVSHLMPPTELLNALTRIGRWRCVEVVVKPTVSAGSNDTYRLDAGDGSAIAKAVQSIVDSDRVAMVQPYLAGVDSYGERGCVYFNGSFDHAFAKAALLLPGAQSVDGLFVPEEIEPADLSVEERAAADAVNSWLTDRFGPLLYARIDLVPGVGGPQVLEVELIEPSFFFDSDPSSATRFVELLGTGSGVTGDR